MIITLVLLYVGHHDSRPSRYSDYEMDSFRHPVRGIKTGTPIGVLTKIFRITKPSTNPEILMRST